MLPAQPAAKKKPASRKSPASKSPASKAPASKSRAAKAPAAKTAERSAATTGVTETKAAPAKTATKATKSAKADKLPVREGEGRWTEKELAEVRAQLAEENAALEAEITASATQIAEGDSSDGAGDDQADAGAKTYEREHELSLAYNSRDMLVQNERAIQRMDEGTYGICESCGKPIGKARLQAFPRATLCVTCKQREERR
jgi:RNA polymerase-binding protein DksA